MALWTITKVRGPNPTEDEGFDFVYIDLKDRDTGLTNSTSYTYDNSAAIDVEAMLTELDVVWSPNDFGLV